MRADEIIKRLAAMPPRAPGVATVPSLELVAMMIRVCRGLRQWKKETLADFAQASLSTVERAERAEQVGVESLDRIARALGYEPGAFTKSRVPISREQATKELVEEWGHLEPVAMREFQTHRQIRMIAAMPAYLIHRPELGSDYDGQVESLIEWLDLVSMVMGSDIIVGGERVRRREFYGQVLAAVDEFRRRGVTVLVGFMDAPLPGIRDWKVAVISLTPKLSDPGASKRRTLFVDRRSVQPRTGYLPYLA